MGVTAYKNGNGSRLWKADFRVTLPGGQTKRLIRKGIPTKEMAERLIQKFQIEAFEGKYFDVKKPSRVTVQKVWEDYALRGQQNRSWKTDQGRAAHLLKHLGGHVATALTQKSVDEYRENRFAETTKRGAPPSSATLDREVELLKRVLNYARQSGTIETNPIADVQLLRQRNTRDRVIYEEDFAMLYRKAREPLKPILLMAYDTGMRLEEILGLRWENVHQKQGCIRLLPQDTKGDKTPRIIFLSERVVTALESLPRSLSGYVFINPKTGERWRDIRKMFAKALSDSGLLKGIWFHDLRRSFITNARRRGVDESTIMRMSGHSTRSAFERYNIVSEEDLRQGYMKIEEGRKAELSRCGTN